MTIGLHKFKFHTSLEILVLSKLTELNKKENTEGALLPYF